MENNFASLLCDDQVLKITEADGRVREIKYKKLSAIRTMDILEKYNKILFPTVVKAKSEKEGTEEDKVSKVLFDDLKSTKKMMVELVDLCLEIIRPKSFCNRVKNLFSGNWVSRKWITNNLDTDQMNEFISLITKPLIGEKKTIVEKA